MDAGTFVFELDGLADNGIYRTIVRGRPAEIDFQRNSEGQLIVQPEPSAWRDFWRVIELLAPLPKRASLGAYLGTQRWSFRCEWDVHILEFAGTVAFHERMSLILGMLNLVLEGRLGPPKNREELLGKAEALSQGYAAGATLRQRVKAYLIDDLPESLEQEAQALGPGALALAVEICLDQPELVQRSDKRAIFSSLVKECARQPHPERQVDLPKVLCLLEQDPGNAEPLLEVLALYWTESELAREALSARLDQETTWQHALTVMHGLQVDLDWEWLLLRQLRRLVDQHQLGSSQFLVEVFEQRAPAAIPQAVGIVLQALHPELAESTHREALEAIIEFARVRPDLVGWDALERAIKLGQPLHPILGLIRVLAPEVRAFPFLSQVLEKSPYGQKRALELILRCGVGGAPLRRCLWLAVGHEDLQQMALEAFGDPSEELLSEIRAGLLESGCPLVAQAAAQLAAPFGEAAVPALRSALGAKEEAVRRASANALGQIGPPALAAVADLILLAGQAGPLEEIDLLVALGLIDPTQAPLVVPGLVKWADHFERANRYAAVQGLARLGPTADEALPFLRKIPSRDPNFQRMLAEAIERLGGGTN